MKRSNTTPPGVMHVGVDPDRCLACAQNKVRDLFRGPPTEQSFLALELAFSGSGGIFSEHKLLQRLQMFCDQPISQLAHWIVDREILHFTWRQQAYVPGFQFTSRVLSPRSDVRQIIEALSPDYDDWEMTTWFAIPNPWLQGRSPVDLLDSAQTAVFEAARVDRYILRG
jgi:hypothetical protein